nr:MAG TPA: hypothetical protein [Bacteriophage sp.]
MLQLNLSHGKGYCLSRWLLCGPKSNVYDE